MSELSLKKKKIINILLLFLHQELFHIKLDLILMFHFVKIQLLFKFYLISNNFNFMNHFIIIIIH